MRQAGRTTCFANLLLLAIVGLTTGALAQDHQSRAATMTSDYAPITLHVACGEVFDAACAKVLPSIAARTAPTGIDLKPAESGGALDPIALVCQDQVAAAIVPADALAERARQPACLGRFDVVGHPLYPLYAFLVVRAGRAGPFARRPRRRPGGARRSPPARMGPARASRWMRCCDPIRPGNERSPSPTMTPTTAPPRIADGSIDGFFAVESLGDVLLDQLRLSTNARGEPLYRFVDIRPGPEFFRARDADGHCLYRSTALDFGGAAPVTTVSVDAVMILGRGYRQAHARGGPFAPDALASAIDATRAAILTDMKSPGDWRPAGTSCQ